MAQRKAVEARSPKAHQVEGTMAYAQREAIQTALDQNAYNLTRTALQLRIGRTTLYRLMDAYDVRATPAEPLDKPGGVQARVTLMNGNWYLAREG